MYITFLQTPPQELTLLDIANILLFPPFSSVPPIVMSLESSSFRFPAAEPYNTFNLTCTASVPESVVIQRTLTWSRKIGSGETGLAEITDNGNTIRIMTSDLTAADVTSVLAVTETVPGDYRYRCEVELSDIIVMESDDVFPIEVVGELTLISATVMQTFTSQCHEHTHTHTHTHTTQMSTHVLHTHTHTYSTHTN